MLGKFIIEMWGEKFYSRIFKEEGFLGEGGGGRIKVLGMMWLEMGSFFG